MTELITPLLEFEDLKDMGSWNHSFVQNRLVRLLPEEDRFVIHIELSLDVSTIDTIIFGRGKLEIMQ